MSISTIELLLMLLGTGGVASIGGVFASLWIGGRGAKNADARLGLDALVQGLKDAQITVDRLKDTMARLDMQAHKALSENNRFRLLHGEIPITSLEQFEPLDDQAWDRILGRFRRLPKDETPTDMREQLRKLD